MTAPSLRCITPFCQYASARPSIQLERFGQLVLRDRGLSSFVGSPPHVEVKLRAIGVDLDRALQVAQRFGQIRSLEEQRAPQVVIDLGRVRSLAMTLRSISSAWLACPDDTSAEPTRSIMSGSSGALASACW